MLHDIGQGLAGDQLHIKGIGTRTAMLQAESVDEISDRMQVRRQRRDLHSNTIGALLRRHITRALKKRIEPGALFGDVKSCLRHSLGLKSCGLRHLLSFVRIEELLTNAKAFRRDLHQLVVINEFNTLFER